MRNKIIVGLWIVFLCAAPVFAATFIQATIDDANDTAIVDVAGRSSAAVQVTGTFTGTLNFQGTLDGSTWVAADMLPSNSSTAVTTTTATGLWHGSVAGYNQFRVSVATWTTGSATVTIFTTEGVAKRPGGGGTGTDNDAIHDNVSGEIAAVTEKATPVGGDLLIIEDSAAANAKKKLQASSLGALYPLLTVYYVSSASDPTADDDTTLGYVVGSIWLNTTDDTAWVALDVTDTAAVWKRLDNVADTDTLDTVFDRGKVIDAANSAVNAVQIGNGTVHWLLYCDGTNVCFIEPDTDGNRQTRIAANFTWCLYDEEAGACILTVDPDAASPNAMYTWGTNYKPLKSVYWSAGALSADATNCADPAEVTINSGPKLWTVICTDNDASTVYGSVVMPDSWDGGTVTFEGSFIQTAADTAVLNGDIAAQCHGTGETVDSTWGTEIAMDIAAMTGSNAVDTVTSAAVTPAGTCAAGDNLFFRWQMDATGTTTAVATLHIVGFKMEYSTSSLSD